ncbi:MAG: M23 family metallopeptidase [Desulfovibrio fairfieldensis]
MSEIQVNKGDVVKKGQTIARTGSTGLAFGDHLHFGMLVGGVEVTPLEWIDPKWCATISPAGWKPLQLEQFHFEIALA